MGNQQPKPQPVVQQVKPQPVITVSVQKKKYHVDQECMIDQIQLEKSKNPIQKKNEPKNDKIVQKPSQKPVQNQKSSQKLAPNQKQLPPLKLRNSRNIGAPLGNCENITNQQNIFQDMQEIQCQKNNQKNNRIEYLAPKSIQRNGSDQKQNGQIKRDQQKKATRTKKFRPSEMGRKNTSKMSSYQSETGNKKQLTVQ